MVTGTGYDSYEETLAAGASISTPIVIDAETSDQAHVYVDDGSGNAVAESYDLTLEVKKTLPHDSSVESIWAPIEVGITGSTARFHPISSFTGGNTDRVFPPSIDARLTLTNSGAAQQNYRIVFETVELSN